MFLLLDIRFTGIMVTQGAHKVGYRARVTVSAQFDRCLSYFRFFPSTAKQVRLTLAKANLRRSETGEKAITMNGLAVAAGVAATTITRLARNDQKAASALSLDLAGKVVTVLDCGIDDLLKAVEN